MAGRRTPEQIESAGYLREKQLFAAVAAAADRGLRVVQALEHDLGATLPRLSAGDPRDVVIESDRTRIDGERAGRVPVNGIARPPQCGLHAGESARGERADERRRCPET